MNGKKLFALLLALCLTVACVPALAAPTRDLQALEVTVDGKLQTLVNIACAAIPKECYGAEACEVLKKDQAPGADLTKQAFWASVLLTGKSFQLSADEAGQLYHQLFTSGEYDAAALAETSRPFAAVTETGLDVNPDVLPIGLDCAYIYAAEFDGSDALVLCDLYFSEVEGADVDEVSEELLTWTNQAELSLRFAPETEFGWTLNSLSLSPSYRDGNFGDWWEAENEALEYSVHIPDSLQIVDETLDHWVFKNLERDVSLTIEAKKDNLTYNQALAAFMQAHPDREVTREELYDAFTLLQDGEFIMVVTADGYPWTFTVTLTFPKERQAEYAFYAEIIRNSFGVWGLARG